MIYFHQLIFLYLPAFPSASFFFHNEVCYQPQTKIET